MFEKLPKKQENNMKKIVLTFDDACKSHLEIAVPILKKYGFNATFFISLPQVWFDDCPQGFLSHDEIAELHKLGFELGNHTMNHHSLQLLSDDEMRRELSLMNDFLAKRGAAKPVSFAYPGGPYAANAAAIIPEFGLKYARTTEHALWDKNTDLMRIPCFSICDKQEENFRKALDFPEQNENSGAVILYHGVPDIAHAHCSTKLELFEAHMKYLYDNKYQVVSMADFGEMLEKN